MPIGIIDNKKIDLTHDEWAMYKKIIESYSNPPYQKGEDFFIDLFETNDDGIITFIKPPTTRHISFEIFLFIMSIMAHQHTRLMYQRADELNAKLQSKIDEIDKKLAELSSK